MKSYLLDTDTCVFFLRGKHDIDKRIGEVGKDNCFISIITLAELKFGAEDSADPPKPKHRAAVAKFEKEFTILPIYSALDFYAKEKSRLRKAGTPIDDFDLSIGSTSVGNKMIMVTNNVSHF